MGVRPPPDTAAEPDAIEFGIPALDARLEDADLSFPADAETICRRLGDPKIPYDAAGNTMALSTAIDEAAASRFDSEQELLNALHPVFERRRESSPAGFLAQLRSLMPF